MKFKKPLIYNLLWGVWSVIITPTKIVGRYSCLFFVHNLSVSGWIITEIVNTVVTNSILFKAALIINWLKTKVPRAQAIAAGRLLEQWQMSTT
jgi:hypothetical protein